MICLKGRLFLFHSIILGLYPCLAAYEFNRHEIPVEEFLRSLPFALVVTAVSVLVMSYLFGSLPKGAVFFSISSILLFAYGPFAKWARADLNTPGSGLVQLEFNQAEILPFSSLVFCIVLLFLWLRRANFHHLSNVSFLLNILSTTVLVMSSITILSGRINEARIKISDSELAKYVFSAKPDSPDIYYIVLDGYGRSDLLKELYGYDNSEFIRSLGKLGFFIAHSAIANYHRTNFSLASTLNGDYLPILLRDLKHKNHLNLYLQKLIHENSLARVLRNAGYQTVSFESGYLTTELRDFDIYQALSSQNRVLSTAMSYIQFPYFREVVSWDIHEQHRQRLLKIFPVALNSSKLSNSPSLNFLHVLAPHPPFVLNGDGSAYNSNKVFNLGDGDDYGGLPDYKERYLGQLQYISKITIDFLTQLLSQNNNTIVVLQADHGPGLHFDRESIERTDVKERYSILSAFYFPGQNYQMLYDSVSPVNTVRILLSMISDIHVPLLQDKSFFSTAGKASVFTEIKPDMLKISR